MQTRSSEVAAARVIRAVASGVPMAHAVAAEGRGPRASARLTAVAAAVLAEVGPLPRPPAVPDVERIVAEAVEARSRWTRSQLETVRPGVAS